MSSRAGRSREWDSGIKGPIIWEELTGLVGAPYRGSARWQFRAGRGLVAARGEMDCYYEDACDRGCWDDPIFGHSVAPVLRAHALHFFDVAS